MTTAQPGQEQMMVTIPRELYLFLMGEGSLDGTWFGDNPIRGVAKGRFWWRSMLQRCATRPTADLGEDGELVERMKRELERQSVPFAPFPEAPGSTVVIYHSPVVDLAGLARAVLSRSGL